MNHGLYIHIPFCSQKCPYCNFYSTVGLSYQDEYLDALLTEAGSLAGTRFDTIYVGGGTPTFLGVKLTGFLEKIASLTSYSGVEFTVEANPESVSVELIKGLAAIPVSRISMGAQSMNNSALKLLGRIHSVKQTLKAYDIVRENSKCSINLDMMYDIPSVDAKVTENSLKRLIALQPEHISAYSYSAETGYLTDKSAEDPYQTEMAAELLESAGYKRYEVSNYAIPGHESIHNTKYWDMSHYYGIGAGAHSMISCNGKRTRYCHQTDIEKYIKNPLGRDNVEIYDEDKSVIESVLFGLRRLEGIDLIEISEKFGTIPDRVVGKINFLADEGLLRCVGNRVKASPEGLLLLDSVMSYLL